MAKVTPKENFLKLAKGEFPYYVPFYSLMGDPYLGECAVKGARISFFADTIMQGGTDMWGVPYAKPSVGIESIMPDTRINVLKDIVPFMFCGALVMVATHFVTMAISNIYLLLVVRVLIAAALYFGMMRLLNVVILRECMQFILKKK